MSNEDEMTVKAQFRVEGTDEIVEVYGPQSLLNRVKVVTGQSKPVAEVSCGCGASASTNSPHVLSVTFMRTFNETHQHVEPTILPDLCYDFGPKHFPQFPCILPAGHTGAHEGRQYNEHLSTWTPIHWIDPESLSEVTP